MPWLIASVLVPVGLWWLGRALDSGRLTPVTSTALSPPQARLDRQVIAELDPSLRSRYLEVRREVQAWLDTQPDGPWGLLAFDGVRTPEDQAKLYPQRSRADGINRRSRHQPRVDREGREYGGAMAVDTSVVRAGESQWDPAAHPVVGEAYERLGQAGRRRGLTWGGAWDADALGFSDPYHLELREEVWV